jgi:hypothetical protein
MKTRENLRVDDNRWRKLCEMVAAESDPHRLSQLLDQLLNELDDRREAIRGTGNTPTHPPATSEDNIQKQISNLRRQFGASSLLDPTD